MTSYVEYRGHGFWCRNEVLREWLRELIAAARVWPNPPDWFPKATGYWDAIVCGLKSYRTDLRLDVDLTSPEIQRECERLFEAVAARRLHATVRRAAQFGLALVRGELDGTTPPVLDYGPDEEWMD